MLYAIFHNLSETDKNQAIEKLISQGSPRLDFFLMTVLALLMATLGLLISSSAVIIGSMLIAPVLYPFLSLALGITSDNYSLMKQAGNTILKTIIIGIIGSTVLTLFYLPENLHLNPEILGRIEPSLTYAVIAIISGLAASFAALKPNLSASFSGIAISVALVPPLAVVGIGLASFSWTIASGALMLFIINAVGVVLASMLVFSLMDIAAKRQIVKDAVTTETKILAAEHELSQHQ